VGSGWRWEADLTSGPSGSSTHARSGLHQCWARVGAGPRPGGRARGRAWLGRAGPREAWSGPRGRGWRAGSRRGRRAGREGREELAARAGPRQGSWAAGGEVGAGPREGKGRPRVGGLGRTRREGEESKLISFLFIYFLFPSFCLFLFPISSSFLFSSRCQIEFFIKPMLHKITHQTK
jgi:hypothetical protein